MLRWLRLNATFLTRGGGFGSIGRPAESAIENESRSTPRKASGNMDQGWEAPDVSRSEEATSFFRKSREPV